jgi:outer membrane protein OmpA-like peptidoglycan-associated protein
MEGTTMRGGTRSALLAVASLTIVIAFGGCAGRSWQFWKTSAPAPTEQARTTAAPVVTATPAAPSATAEARAATETVPPAPSFNATTELPEYVVVRFRPGQASVAKADMRVLDGIVRWLKDHPGSVVVVEGHTDDLGTQSENMAIGEKRAASIMRYLVSRGLEPVRVSIISYGSDHPVCAEKTDSCRAKNRRADLLVKQH